MFSIPIYCITLPEYPERKEKAKQHFIERGVAARFFDGIHAGKFGLETILPYEVDVPGSNYNMGWPRVGCWLSHFMLMSALNMMWDDISIVVEDDIEWPVNWHTLLTTAIADAGDFDLLWFGSCCCEGKPKTLIAGNVYEVQWPLCTHGYAVRKRAIPVILETQRNARVYAPYDISLALHTFPKLKTYTVLPRIAGQFDTLIPE